MTERKYFNLFQPQQNISLSQYRSFKDFAPKNLQLENEDRKIMKFSPEKQTEELQKLQWRKKTEFPIIKILSYRKLNKEQSSNKKYPSKKVLVQLTLQPIFYTLSEIDQILIFKVFYLLKETLIGVERLCNVYGNFLLKSNMIAIDSKKRCKVWHNSKFHFNIPQFSCQSQEETVRSVLEVYSTKTKSSLKSTKFYRDLQKCRTFCDCLLILKNFIVLSQTRILSSFVLVDKFSSNMCSPRKYISRPPSSEYTPESPQTTLEKFKSPNFETHKISQSETWKFAKFTGSRAKVNSFAGINNRPSPDLNFRTNFPTSPRRTQRNVFENYFKRETPKRQEIESISPKSVNKVNKANMLFPLQSKGISGIMESVFEDPEYLSICQNQIYDHPQIRPLELVIKDDESDSKNNTVLYRSSIQLRRSLTENDLCSNMMGSGDFETNDEIISPLKAANITKAFRPLMKLIDGSFDKRHYHRY